MLIKGLSESTSVWTLSSSSAGGNRKSSPRRRAPALGSVPVMTDGLWALKTHTQSDDGEGDEAPPQPDREHLFGRNWAQVTHTHTHSQRWSRVTLLSSAAGSSPSCSCWTWTQIIRGRINPPITETLVNITNVTDSPSWTDDELFGVNLRPQYVRILLICSGEAPSRKYYRRVWSHGDNKDSNVHVATNTSSYKVQKPQMVEYGNWWGNKTETRHQSSIKMRITKKQFLTNYILIGPLEKMKTTEREKSRLCRVAELKSRWIVVG